MQKEVYIFEVLHLNACCLFVACCCFAKNNEKLQKILRRVNFSLLLLSSLCKPLLKPSLRKKVFSKHMSKLYIWFSVYNDLVSTYYPNFKGNTQLSHDNWLYSGQEGVTVLAFVWHLIPIRSIIPPHCVRTWEGTAAEDSEYFSSSLNHTVF